jgi:Na+/proline symporter
MLTINGLIGIVAQPHMLAAVGTGRDEITCRVGMAYGNFVKRFCTIGWALVGLIVAVMLAQAGAEPLVDREDAFGFATRELLFPGAIGLMIACVLAANMSTCSAFTVDGGALFTQNLYKRYWVRDQTDRHYLNVGRLAGVSVTTLGVVFGLYVDVVLEAFLFTETIAAFMGISMIAAISWRRSNRHGALASLVLSSVLFFYLTHSQFGEFLRWDAANFGWSLLLGFVTLIVVSLATPPEPERMLKPFYENLDRQSFYDEASEKEIAVEKEGHDLLVVHMFNMGWSKGAGHVFRRFKVDIEGLLLAFGVVVILIALAKGILYLP